jgi:hypothetical protein
MMKTLRVFSLLCIILTLSNCHSLYKVVKETPTKQDLKSYKTLYLGWADLKEADYEMYGYETKDEWTTAINELNTKGIQLYISDLCKSKTIYVAKNNGDKPEIKEGLYIEFSKIGIMNQAEYLIVDFRLIDLATGLDVYSTQSLEVNYTIMNSYQFGSQYSFEGRVNSLLYNLLVFVTNKINMIKT